VKVELRRSGGFAGIAQEPVEIDTDLLPAADRDALEARVRGALAEGAPEVVGADLPRVELAVVDGEGTHELAWADDGGPATASLRTLADHVERAAGSEPG
jgi:hypothetical protein